MKALLILAFLTAVAGCGEGKIDPEEQEKLLASITSKIESIKDIETLKSIRDDFYKGVDPEKIPAASRLVNPIVTHCRAELAGVDSVVSLAVKGTRERLRMKKTLSDALRQLKKEKVSGWEEAVEIYVKTLKDVHESIKVL